MCNVFASTKSFLLHDNSGFFGVLSAIEPAEDHQVAMINGHPVILPLDLDLAGFLNQYMGVACIAGKFYARLAGEAWDRATAKERAVCVGGRSHDR